MANSQNQKHIPKIEFIFLKFTNMQTPNKQIFFLLFLPFLITTKCKENTQNNLSDLCLTQVCSFHEPVIRRVKFPFIIINDSLPSSCGYPGFDLLCNGDDKLQIHLPNSGVFSIKEIDYVKQELLLNDPGNCLPRRLLALNYSKVVVDSPFNPVFEQDYVFYNCSNEFFNSSDDQIRPIKCLSGENYGVFATPLEKIVKGNSSLCRKIGIIKGPFRPRSSEMDSFSNLEGDIGLTWAQPRECGECYRRSGKCGFKSNSNFEVGCFNLPRRDFTRGSILALTLSFAIPLLLVTFCITYICIKKKCSRRRTTLESHTLASTVTPQPRRVIHGLDQSIIESYPKVVLGESRRLPKPATGEKNCPICLGEYLAKDILRTIPNCGHCFHVDCVDEWLLLNASCPVCRNSPPNTPENNA
ncbi:putative RING-H2 finger protein ATL21A [Spinacia oleracea]|uniref:RING-type E3 ubiquitin transferase n=1 Tax=Spinacia oleracea TaxID=3562 RepID=A0A9R0JM19_SPIOL|nr:putative RING-H2 finger protein ATL21A [Spinacia oleracea]